MKKITSLTLAVLFFISAMLFTGCALTPDRAAFLTPHELCKTYVTPGLIKKMSGDQRIAYSELQRRNIQCDVQAYIAADNARRQRLIQGAIMLNQMSKPPPPPAATSFSCTKMGVFTNCNPY